MPKQQSYSISERKFFLRVLDILSVIGTIILAKEYLDFHYFNALESNIVLWLATLGFYIIFFGQIFELYNLKVASSRYLIVRSAGITALLVTIFYIFTPIIAPVLPANRLQILYLFGTIFLPIVVWRFLYVSFVFLPKYHKYLLLIGDADKLSELIKLIRKKAPDNLVLGYFSETEIEGEESIKHFDPTNFLVKNILNEYSITEIVVAKSNLSQSLLMHNQLIHLFENGILITSAKRFIERITSLVPEIDMKDAFYDYLTISQSHESKFYLSIVRLVDIVAGLIGILFFTLTLPLILIGNLIGNRGNLFYYQVRVGKNGESFTIIKLRTMIKNAERNGAVWAEKKDSRITPFGKFLRYSRLDEIPQFINILKGDMSLIGPRPERPEFVNDLESKIPFYAIRHVVKPGLTGWAQVMHPYADNLEEYNLKVRYDLYYIKERSLLMDFKIIIKTITTVLFFRGQ